MMWQLRSQQRAASPWKMGVLQVLYLHVPTPSRVTGVGEVWWFYLGTSPRPLYCPLQAGACRVGGSVWALTDMEWIPCVWELCWGAAVWGLTAWCRHFSAVCESMSVCLCVCPCRQFFTQRCKGSHCLPPTNGTSVWPDLYVHCRIGEPFLTGYFSILDFFFGGFKNILMIRIAGLLREHLMSLIWALVSIKTYVTVYFLSEEKYAGLFLSSATASPPPPLISYALISQILPDVALAAFASPCFCGFSDLHLQPWASCTCAVVCEEIPAPRKHKV